MVPLRFVKIYIFMNCLIVFDLVVSKNVKRVKLYLNKKFQHKIFYK